MRRSTCREQCRHGGVQPLRMIHLRKFFLCEIPHVENLITIRTQTASYNPAVKDRADVGGSVAIGVIDQKVTSAVHTKYSGDFHQQSRLFPCFTHSCVGRLLAGLANAPRRNPNIFVTMKTQQESHLFIMDCYSSRRQNQQIMADLLPNMLHIRRHWHEHLPPSHDRVARRDEELSSFCDPL